MMNTFNSTNDSVMEFIHHRGVCVRVCVCVLNLELTDVSMQHCSTEPVPSTYFP